MRYFIVAFIIVTGPQACTLHTPRLSQNTHTHQNDSNEESSLWSGRSFHYLLVLLGLIILNLVLVICCCRLQNTKRCKRMKRHINVRLGQNTNNGNHDDGNNPPSYDNITMTDIHIVTKSPPYVKDPPSYNEAIGNPTDLPDFINTNGEHG